MVISELVRRIRDSLSENAEFEAAEIVMHVLGTDRNGLILGGRHAVTADEEKKAAELAKRRRRGEPLQYILGSAWFMDFEFEVGPSVLIPRSDTETLVEYAVGKLQKRGAVRLLDIGTGSGCIGISIAKYCPETKPTLLDISADALAVAERNAKRLGVDARLLRLDIMSSLPDEKYDVIVSNPPYIRSEVIPTLQTEVKDHEPLTALDGGGDGLCFYRRITDAAPQILEKGGMLIFEIGYDQGGEVAELMRSRFADVEIIKDLCGNDRVVAGIMR